MGTYTYPVMSSREEEDFLYSGRILRLASIKKDGTPHIVPVWYLYENGKIYLWTDAASIKVKNIRRNNTVAMCVDVGEAYYDLKNVIMKGKCKVLKDESLAMRIEEKFCTKYFGSSSHPQAKEYLSKEANHLVIEIEPSKKWHSEDFSRLLKKQKTGLGKRLTK